MRYAASIPHTAPEPPPQAEPHRRAIQSFALFLLFFAVHFAIVSLLTIVVLREVTASSETPRWSVSREFPSAWPGITRAWSALNAPTQWLDALARAGNVPLYRWSETSRVLFQCGLCGFVWGAVTFVLYLLARGIVYEARRSLRTKRAPAMPVSESPAIPASG